MLQTAGSGRRVRGHAGPLLCAEFLQHFSPRRMRRLYRLHLHAEIIGKQTLLMSWLQEALRNSLLLRPNLTTTFSEPCEVIRHSFAFRHQSGCTNAHHWTCRQIQLEMQCIQNKGLLTQNGYQADPINWFQDHGSPGTTYIAAWRGQSPGTSTTTSCRLVSCRQSFHATCLALPMSSFSMQQHGRG